MNREEAKRLKELSYRMMIDVLQMTTEAGSGHPGGSLSSKDIIAVLFFKIMRHNPKNPTWEDRDRLVFSKGHAVPILYAALIEAGYLDRSYITKLRKFGSPLQGHPEWNPSLMIEATTGSLGNGLATKGKGSLIGEWVTEFHGKPLSKAELEKLLPQLEEKHIEEMKEIDVN